MTISALSDSTKRLLGSPLVVSTPATLVKELLDNAIDAKATAIEVLISQNAIDKIEVRDNGTGIHPDDYDSLAKPGHTSKLRTFEELRTLGGATLGFRGEALASANALAKIKVTTKTATQPVATIIHVAPKTGGVLSQQPCSAPIGTTVSVTGLYEELPVRKQGAVKESIKSLENIKDLLRSYAMTRPHLRLVLKIFKNPKFSWSYAPKRDADPLESLIQLFGTEVASGCFHKLGTGLGLMEEDCVTQAQYDHTSRLFVFDALLMKPGATSQLPKHRYISVDHRPISHCSRTAKKLMSVYQRYVNGNCGKDFSPSDLFIRLNIDCPAGSYDTNVEPSKNDVLFEDELALLKHFECFCAEVYGPPTSNIFLSKPSPISDINLSAETEPPGFTVLDIDREIDRQTIEPSNNLTNTIQPDITSMEMQSEVIGEPLEATSENIAVGLPLSSVRCRPSTPAPSTWTTINAPFLQTREAGESSQNSCSQDIREPIPTLHGVCDVSNDLNEQTDEYREERERAKRYETIHNRRDAQREATPFQQLNPWSITRNYHSRGRPRLVSESEGRAQDLPPSGVPLHPVMTPEPDILRHFAAPPRDLDVPQSLRYPNIDSHASSVSELVPSGPYRSPISSPMMIAQNQGLRPRHANPSSRRHAQPLWTPPSSFQKEYDSSYRSSRLILPDGLKQTTLSFGATQAQGMSGAHPSNETLRQSNANDDFFPTTGQHPRNTNHQHDHENTLRDSVSDRKIHSQQSKHQNMHEPFATLHATDLHPNKQHMEDREPIRTSLPTGDPRAYLLRRQKSMAAVGSRIGQAKLRRMKSNLMPLENIPAVDQTHHLVTTKEVDVQHLSTLVEKVKGYDKYILEGDIQEGLDMDLDEGRRVETRLNHTLACWSEASADEQTSMHIGLSEFLKGKGPPLQSSSELWRDI